MKIYTKTGDTGTTALIGGKRVPKNHKRIEAYGTVDELIAILGVVRDFLKDTDFGEEIIEIQDKLMTCAAILATDCDDCDVKVPKLSEGSIVWLEKRIDEMDSRLIPLTHFILPGGHPAVSFCHVARTICRRAERAVIAIQEFSTVPGEIIRYLNRLSDYLFTLSRLVAVDFQASEIPWKPQL
ncbi:MAG: cob(I)yrinic acid a,c-diamide adenosyltransferase [Bacteroidales bacterium]|nr:cob(I)yrinic acid a,c-diamide adenosyltransferase [Bacteroidales bacterium]